MIPFSDHEDETTRFYLLAPAGLEGPFDTVAEARSADRGRGLDIAATLPPTQESGSAVQVVGLRLVDDAVPALPWDLDPMRGSRRIVHDPELSGANRVPNSDENPGTDDEIP